MRSVVFASALLVMGFAAAAEAQEKPPLADHPLNRWVKRTPLADTPVSPRLGYEGACVWDSTARLMVRYGGHNQGGGGEQGAEVWTFDPATAQWQLMQPNTSPPGVCCNAQNVYAPNVQRYVRFPFFSGGHGWQWERELYLNDSSVWTYDLAANRWRNMRPLPTPKLAPYRSASWDSDRQVAVVFGGEGGRDGTVVYDPYRNEWNWPRPSGEPESRSGGTMAYDAARKLHILFGSQFTDDPHTWAYDAARKQWRDMQPPSSPPTEKNDAVLTYDPINQVVIGLIKVTRGEDDNATHEVQTWSYDAGANRWQKLDPDREPDPAGNRSRNLMFAPELNLAILENCTSRPREQQVWTYRYAAHDRAAESPAAAAAAAAAGSTQQRPAAPPIVSDAVVSVVTPARVELRWQAPLAAKVAGYHVERAAVEVWSDDQLARLKARTPPGEMPVVGAIRRIGPFQQLTSEPIAAAEYVDAQVDLQQPAVIEGEPIYERAMQEDQLDTSGRAYRLAVYAYRIVAVDEAGNASGPSPAFFTIPSSPQHLFSREQGESCELKWEPNPESRIAGYRVYRMDGRWNKDSVSRLNQEPIESPAYADPSAGESTRRYYVVAVDQLGQEGFPSSPVWHRREWQPYYEPFVGQWHQ